MKKIVPFRKEINLNNLHEITSISLEHSLKHEGNTVTGEFIVSGDYRVTETSINTEPFSYNLPCKIEIDDKYKTDALEIDIDDFYYEIIDNKILAINIDVLLNKLEEILEPVKELVKEPILESVREDKEDMDSELVDEPKEISCIEQEEEKPPKKEMLRDPEEIEIKSIFNNINEEESYLTYRVYIVRENDTVDTIITKYNITKEKLEEYNDLTLLKIGDKVIIPNVKD